MPLRRLSALIHGLPPDSSLSTAIRLEREREEQGPRKVSLAELGGFFASHGAKPRLN